jgi:hypothetical protein
MNFTGMPYGPHAFQRHRAIVFVVPPHRDIYLLDARVVAGNDPETLRGWLGQVRKQAEAAFFHVGPREAYAGFRSRFQDEFPHTPMLFASRREPSVMATLFDIAGTLDLTPARRAIVVTDNAELALQAAAGGGGRFDVRFIGAAPADIRNQPHIRIYSSLAKLKENVASQPIRR